MRKADALLIDHERLVGHGNLESVRTRTTLISEAVVFTLRVP